MEIDLKQAAKNMKTKISFIIYTSIIMISCILKKYYHSKHLIGGIKKIFDDINPFQTERMNLYGKNTIV